MVIMDDKKKKLVPALRFSEFEGEWEDIKYGNIYTFYSTNSFSRDNLNYEKGIVKNIHYGDIHTKFQTMFDIEKELVPFVNEDINISKIASDNYCKEKDLVIADASEDYADIGKSIEIINLNKERVIAGLHTFLARPNKRDLASGFGGYLMQSWAIRKQIMTIAQGTKVLGLSTKRVVNVLLTIPTLPEQQKIANFLSSVDKKIEQLRQKVSLLEDYKKGVMQQIFSQQIRFKDDNGEAFADWEYIKLGKLTYKVGKKNKENIQYPIYSINNQEGFLPQSEQFEGMDSNDRGYDISLYKIIKKGTFAYNPARINVGSIGFSGELDNVIISSLYVCFKTKENLEDAYLLKFLDTFDFNKGVLRNVEGGVRQYLFYDNFSSIKIPLPSNKEQLRIADFLNSIDEKIKQNQIKVKQAQQFKKGLLQQLFV
ncbi:restriction endonuclease subunit S [Aureispira sp. CCB-E]|uniref:restriction endonuclease subunit S n=1 Tax=Aureispira sp. CCB-E TaxID=3051121 RepID=UPI002868D4B5|nr:restriction endonuclease subunit S [Aureispira sp. CCB-E]WMX15920.1 restriction endonuclease subunit S [Aureispira sp. CCB-E]